MIGSTFSRWTTFLLFLCGSFAMKVKVHHYTRVYTPPIFDASIRAKVERTMYYIDEKKSNADLLDYVHLDERTGFLYIKRIPSCSVLYFTSFRYAKVNLMYLYISATSFVVSEIVERRVFTANFRLIFDINRLGCDKNSMSQLDVKLDDLLVQYYHDKPCDLTTVRLMNLMDAIPLYLSRCVSDISITYEKNLAMSHDRYVHMSNCRSMNHHMIAGQIFTSCSSDRSFSYEFIVSSENHTTTASRIRYNSVENIRDHHHHRSKRSVNTQPIFAKTLYEKHVNEEQAAGVLVDIITASDPDRGDAGTLVYSLKAAEDSRSESMFKINPNSGKITTTRILDREYMREHYFRITANDLGQPAQSATTMFKIYVDDINDHAPEFEHDEYSRDISENSHSPYYILSVRATDKDVGDNKMLRYSILNPQTPNDVFKINAKNGRISLEGELDRERIASYQLNVIAVDQGVLSTRKSATAVVKIGVIDENDNSPVFTRGGYVVSVKEDIDTTKHPVIITISATDRDTLYSDITFRITNPDGIFSIDPKLGTVSLIKPLDYETANKYLLNIRALDNGSPPRTNSTLLEVDVIDVNDNYPIYENARYEESVKENIGAKQQLVLVSAFDEDSGKNGELRYRIKNAPLGMPIVINKTSGWLTTLEGLDREKDTSYMFEVVATDLGVPPKSASTSVIITVVDVNDNPPIFKPKVYHASVSEEARRGKRVTRVTATDKDIKEHARISYSITAGNTNNAFKIRTQRGEGIITVYQALDYKRVKQYALTVMAADRGGLKDTARVFINVTAINRYQPQFQQKPYQVYISEDVRMGHVVTKVKALDSDVGENARVTYSIEGDGVQVFKINPHTGEIRTRLSLDREKRAGYVLSVMATDHGKPPKIDTTDVEIIVTDVNDNAPEFVEASYSGTVKENADPGTSVLQLSATDRDIGQNGEFYFTFADDQSENGGDFLIEESSGEIRLAKKIDRETIAYYNLIAYVIDRGVQPIGPKSMSVTVKIKVEDVNDNAPEFPSDVLDIYIQENSPVGSVVGSITAHDPDDGINAQVEYLIINGLDSDLFQLVSRPGDPAIIKTKTELDYESDRRTYKLNIRAVSGHLLKDAKIIIHVQDVNDNKPVLNNFVIVLNNFPSNFPNVIGRVPASDPDVNDVLSYSFTSGNDANLLHLNESTGEISLPWLLLNSDVSRNGSFDVKVSDGKYEEHARCDLHVRLVTDTMLMNSVTIRLNNMTQTAFLSPLFKFFKEALASIINTSPSNIFVINVRDDNDVSAQILNVSVSVRKHVSDGKNTFYSPQFLMETIYLHRILLANLSTLQVLPFDDNMCVRELCSFYELCQSTLKDGNAAPFISSQTMLFRPIHPHNTYQCHCPPGFAGTDKNGILCDVEVNLCYSSPCGSNGTCKRREGGYTCLCLPGFAGKNCEIDMKSSQSVQCPSHICHSPSRCVTNENGRGFRCIGCPKSIFRDKFCKLTARSFSHGSYLTFPSLKRRHRFHMRLSFATWDKHALLFYNGRYNDRHDFIALEIINSQLQFSFSLGDNITTTTTHVPGGVSNGEWHEATIDYLNRTVTLTSGADCDPGIAVKHGQKVDYMCAARVTRHLPKKCDNPSELCMRLLDLTGPFQLGGLPQLATDFQVKNRVFAGCIKDVYLDHELLDLENPVGQNVTQRGCPAKNKFCLSSPCQNSGTCREGWNTFICDCPARTGGKTCSSRIDNPVTLYGDGYLKFSPANRLAGFTWYNGIAFRTRAKDGVLMAVSVKGGKTITTRLERGFLVYDIEFTQVRLSTTVVNDGQWHHIEAKWKSGRITLSLDYGHLQMLVPAFTKIGGQQIASVHIGGHYSADKLTNGFVGCLKSVVVGNRNTSFLSDAEMLNVHSGCRSRDVCQDQPCGDGQCVDEWNSYRCVCRGGHFGKSCDKDICKDYNPCKSLFCQPPSDSSNKYTCECGSRETGRYCEETVRTTCPTGWWGNNSCGPCNCDQTRGFDPSCGSDGVCKCKPNHYHPPSSQVCHRCNCYSLGSRLSQCHPKLGNCFCKPGISGRRCNRCADKFAEINGTGCFRVLDRHCPAAYEAGVWWDRTPFGNLSHRECPRKGVGDAKRKCTTDSWLEPDLSNCTSPAFHPLINATVQLRQRGVNPFLSRNYVALLANATHATEVLFMQDVNISYHLLLRILRYENAQSGLSLTSERDRNFIPNVVRILSKIFRPEYMKHWANIKSPHGSGAENLAREMETYQHTLAKNMGQAQGWPFAVITDNIVFMVDSINKLDWTTKRIPKYNNIVRTEKTFDEVTSVTMPAAIIPESAKRDDFLTDNKRLPKLYVGFTLYKNLGDILPLEFHETVEHYRRLVVNSAVVSFVLRSRYRSIDGSLPQPINITFKLLTSANRTNPQCVYWKFSNHQHNGSGGSWSREGCRKLGQYMGGDGSMFVRCACNHLSSYAVLMDVTDSKYHRRTDVAKLVLRYVCTMILVVCIFISVLFFSLIRRVYSNINSIRINYAINLVIIHLTYLIGIDKPRPDLACRFVAIILHYFYVSSFSWLFVEMLHLYRMMTEKRGINHGSMKFYYVLGYVVPGIAVGLAVGLDTEQYNNDVYCWLSWERTGGFIWSLLGPVIAIVVINTVVFLLALKTGINRKKQEDVRTLSYTVLWSMMVFFISSLVFVFALLSVKSTHGEVLAFHYIHSVLVALQGIFVLNAYIIASKRMRYEIERCWKICRGIEDIEEKYSESPNAVRSALAYRHGDDKRHHHVGISTTSTTSRSTNSDTNHGVYKGDQYLHSTSTSTSDHHHSHGDAPYDPSGFHEKQADDTSKALPRDSDSESDASDGRPSMDLASSHSSDDEDDDDAFPNTPEWDQQLPSTAVLDKIKRIRDQQPSRKLMSPSGGGSPQHTGDKHTPPTPIRDVTGSPYIYAGRTHASTPPYTRPDVIAHSASPPLVDAERGTDVSPNQTQVTVVTHHRSVSSDSDSSSSETSA